MNNIDKTYSPLVEIAVCGKINSEIYDYVFQTH